MFLFFHKLIKYIFHQEYFFALDYSSCNFENFENQDELSNTSIYLMLLDKNTSKDVFN